MWLGCHCSVAVPDTIVVINMHNCYLDGLNLLCLSESDVVTGTVRFRCTVIYMSCSMTVCTRTSTFDA